LDSLRVQTLAANYSAVWGQVKSQITDFINWLRALADQLETNLS
jgi:hypothetical protein